MSCTRKSTTNAQLIEQVEFGFYCLISSHSRTCYQIPPRLPNTKARLTTPRGWDIRRHYSVECRPPPHCDRRKAHACFVSCLSWLPTGVARWMFSVAITNVFSFLPNESVDRSSFRSVCSLFHARGAATEKLCNPSLQKFNQLFYLSPKFHENPAIIFWVIKLTHRQTAEVISWACSGWLVALSV